MSLEDKANRIVIMGCENGEEFSSSIMANTGVYNPAKVEQEIVAVATKMLQENDDIGSILLECTELSPHAAAVQDAVRMPVWDYTTLTKWIHSGCIRRPFVGHILEVVGGTAERPARSTRFDPCGRRGPWVSGSLLADDGVAEQGCRNQDQRVLGSERFGSVVEASRRPPGSACEDLPTVMPHRVHEGRPHKHLGEQEEHEERRDRCTEGPVQL